MKFSLIRSRRHGAEVRAFSGIVRSAVLASMMVLAIALSASPALAGFEEGRAAYEAENYELAYKEFRKLAEQGHAGAQRYLGLMYSRGRGVDRSRRAAWSEGSALVAEGG